MNHYQLKKQSEQDLQDILDLSNFQDGRKITNQSQVNNAIQPLYYSAESSQFADSANLDGLTMFVIYRETASSPLRADDRSGWISVSYSLTFYIATITEQNEMIAEQYMDDLLGNLQNHDWQISFIDESKQYPTDGTKKMTQLVYSIDKVF